MKIEDINHLEFIYGRLENVHKESVDYPFMVKFNKIITELKKEKTIKIVTNILV